MKNETAMIASLAAAEIHEFAWRSGEFPELLNSETEMNALRVCLAEMAQDWDIVDVSELVEMWYEGQQSCA